MPVLQLLHVTLSHLRSKEFQRIYLPCIPQHRETSKCTLVYIEMYPQESGCTSKRASHFHQSKCGLDVDEVVVPPSVCFIEAQIEINCGNKSMFCDDYHKLKCWKKQQSNEGVLVSLPFYKLENVT